MENLGAIRLFSLAETRKLTFMEINLRTAAAGKLFQALNRKFISKPEV